MSNIPIDQIKIFEDEELTKDTKGVLDLGTIDAGEEKEYTFYVFNDSLIDFFNMQFEIREVDDLDNLGKTVEELKVIEAPLELKPKVTKELKIFWRSSVSIEELQRVKLRIQANFERPRFI